MLDDEGGKEGRFVVKLVFIRGCYLHHLESLASLITLMTDWRNFAPAVRYRKWRGRRSVDINLALLNLNPTFMSQSGREEGRKKHALHYLPPVLRLLSALSFSPACAIAIGLLDRNSMSLATKSRRRRNPRCNSPRSSRQTF